ncbi:putative peptide modification system cyclase [Thermomonas sp.]|uniref:putative peptide modification system cyclase n=1 Tax=Thermomonas sp. TaxID=1971895 RepID=UPI0035B38CF3
MVESQVPSTPQVRTLLLTDLVDSTGLVERIGDTAAAALFRAHDRIVLDLQQRWRGRLIDRSDGLLLIFERPIDGLGFALDYVRGLRELGREHNQPLQARAGLHVGEVLLWENSLDAVQLGAKSLEVEGLAKPLAGRLMALARPGQILLSATAEPLAHRAARELGERGELLVWKSYGRWRFKGVPEAQEIHEVGEPGLAPLRMPSHTPKAWRDLPLWRRPVALAAETMLLAGLLVGGWFITRPQPAIAFGERDWVVVGDLRNLTGDPRLDDSLEQAFRISLEQSRYVNVLSDLKVRETMQRMQRPDDAKVDRASGSEIALRDGARALLLPTVAEVGGRLRVSAEVVDPRTQTTVYAVSADGKGIDSALDSIDDVTDQLREQLGEAMQNVQKTSVPLPNAATPSLEALKAFAVARNVYYTTRDREQALGLYRRALQLDPQFALAHADIARLLAGFGEVGAAADEWRKALAIPGRLSPQEKQRIELMLLQHAGPTVYFRKVDEYLALYPDDSEVISRSGTNIWHQLNDFRAAEARYRAGIKPAYANQGSIQYGLGIMLLGQERDADALAAFRRSREWGFSGWSEFHARVYDIRGQHEDADRIYLQSSAGKTGWQGEEGVVTWIDRGDLRRASEMARAWHRRTEDAGDRLESLRARAAIASVDAIGNARGVGNDLRALIADSRRLAREVDAVYPPTSVELQLYAGLLAAYTNDRGLVADALLGTEDSRAVRDYPTVGQLREVVLAEQERLSGNAEAAVARLGPLARQENALVAVHWALMNAQRATGNTEAALERSQWLATHRGRVFVEATTTEVLQFFNVAVAAQARKDNGAGTRAEQASPGPAVR